MYTVKDIFMFKYWKVRSNTEDATDSEQAADLACTAAAAAGMDTNTGCSSAN